MRRLLIALTAVGLLCLPVPSALAQTQGPDPCQAQVLQMARGSLLQSYGFTPMGVGPYGWAPLTQPFGPDPWDIAALYSPPGLLAAYGPLGPGLTSTALLAQTFPNGITPSTLSADPTAGGTLLALAGLQQAELANLTSRYGLGASYLQATGQWISGTAGRVGPTLTILGLLCRQRQGGAGGRGLLPSGLEGAGAAGAMPSGAPVAPER